MILTEHLTKYSQKGPVFLSFEDQDGARMRENLFKLALISNTLESHLLGDQKLAKLLDEPLFVSSYNYFQFERYIDSLGEERVKVKGDNSDILLLLESNYAEHQLLSCFKSSSLSGVPVVAVSNNFNIQRQASFGFLIKKIGSKVSFNLVKNRIGNKIFDINLDNDPLWHEIKQILA